ncbi:MAG: hypothetical protein K2Y12_12080 [Chitinophagaceae bacterium]|nr:hypothetical protein [Chitinophagaceae bacterium]
MKFDLATKRIEEMDDRQLLELILMNQITIYQKLDRFNTYALKKLGAELAQEGEHKDQSY